MVRHRELARKGASALRVRSHVDRGVGRGGGGRRSERKKGRKRVGRNDTNANETTC